MHNWQMYNVRFDTTFDYLSHLLLYHLQNAIEILHWIEVATIADEGVQGIENLFIAHRDHLAPFMICEVCNLLNSHSAEALELIF